MDTWKYKGHPHTLVVNQVDVAVPHATNYRGLGTCIHSFTHICVYSSIRPIYRSPSSPLKYERMRRLRNMFSHYAHQLSSHTLVTMRPYIHQTGKFREDHNSGSITMTKTIIHPGEVNRIMSWAKVI